MGRLGGCLERSCGNDRVSGLLWRVSDAALSQRAAVDR